MKRKNVSRSAFFELRVFVSFLLVVAGIVLVVAAMGISSATTAKAQSTHQTQGLSGPPLLSPQDAQKMAEGIKQLVNNSTEGLVPVRHPNGATSIDLQGRFQNVVMAKKEADGTVTQACVDNVDSAAAFLEIDPALVGGQPRTAPLPAAKPDIR
jgi:hypothetical protein